MKKHETSATFSCSQCGECCRHINLVPALAAFDTGTGVCKYLAGNLCSIYDTRPLICRVDAMYEAYFSTFCSREEYYRINQEVCRILRERHLFN